MFLRVRNPDGREALAPFSVDGASDPHAYFTALQALPSHWKSYSLRDQAQIDSVSLFAPNPWVTFDPVVDAAKSVIPAFRFDGWALGAPVAPGDDRIVFDRPLTHQEKNLLVINRGLLLGDEILRVHIPGNVFGAQFSDGDTTLLVQRGQFDTAAVAHAAGLPVGLSQNNLISYLRLPLGTQDGYAYLFTWDVKYDASYLGTDLNVNAIGRKEFHLTSYRNGKVWLETRFRPDGTDGLGKSGIDRTQDLAVVDVRYYDTSIPSAAGSNVTSPDPLRPQAARFIVRPERWTRYWWHIDQRADDLDRASLWIADEQTPPVKVIDDLTLRVQGDTTTPPHIFSWWLQQNTSQDIYRGSRRDLVSYVRNFMALRDPQDVPALLVQPGKEP